MVRLKRRLPRYASQAVNEESPDSEVQGPRRRQAHCCCGRACLGGWRDGARGLGWAGAQPAPPSLSHTCIRLPACSGSNNSRSKWDARLPPSPGPSPRTLVGPLPGPSGLSPCSPQGPGHTLSRAQPVGACGREPLPPFPGDTLPERHPPQPSITLVGSLRGACSLNHCLPCSLPEREELRAQRNGPVPQGRVSGW